MNPPDSTAAVSTSVPIDEPVVFDASVLGEMFGSETALIASVLQTFMVGTRSSLTELVQAFADQDLPTVAALAHRITGASRMSGAQALGHAARAVEQAAKQNNLTLVEQGMGVMHAQWTLLQDAIALQ